MEVPASPYANAWLYAALFSPPPYYCHMAAAQEPIMTTAAPKRLGSSFTIDAILGKERPAVETKPTRPAFHPYYHVSPVALERLSEGKSHSREASRSGNRLSSSTHSATKSERRGKRLRTIFTAEQLEKLESEFERRQYMVGSERFYLATRLRLTEAQVKVWFQNRRIKWRKQTASPSLCDASSIGDDERKAIPSAAAHFAESLQLDRYNSDSDAATEQSFDSDSVSDSSSASLSDF